MVAIAPEGGNRRERRKLARTAKKAVALTLTGFLLGGGYAGITETLKPSYEAQALSFGPGIHDQATGGFAGGYYHGNGNVVYCLELGKLPDMTNSSPALSAKTTIPAYTTPWIMQGGQTFHGVGAGALSSGSSQYPRIAFLMGKYGQTQNDQQAAALALAIWEIRGEVGKTGDYDALLNYEKSTAGSGATTQSAAMLSEAANYLSGGGDPGGATEAAGAPVLHSTYAYTGFIDVKAGTSKLVLENAVFDQTGTGTITWEGGAPQDLTVNWTGVPPEGWDRYYRVTVNGEYVYYTEAAKVIYATDGDAVQQSTGYAPASEPEEHTGTFEATYVDPDRLWAPQLTTEVPAEFVKKGESFADTVSFFASESEPYAEWLNFTSGGVVQYAPIKATGTLYGPFAVDPALNPSATVPAGSPVAWTGEVTATDGPGTYPVDTGEVAKESGYYTFVWDINFKDQLEGLINPASGHASLPADYFFTDGFGQALEGQTVPTSIEFSTQLSSNEVAMGETITDEIEVSLHDGLWLRGADGKRLPYTLEGSVYLSDEEPVQQSVVPENARKVTSFALTVDDTGKMTSDPFRVPVTSAGWLTVQWCVTGEDQVGESQYKVEDFCDDYGVPSETAEILKPEVTTQAQEQGAVFGEIKDTAFVEGAMPDLPAEVDFTLFLKPEAGQSKYDENWKEQLDENGDVILWTEDELNDPAAVCEAQPVAKTDRVEVGGVGEYDSPAVTAKTPGTMYWVEELFVEDPETGEDVLLHRGECGLPDETTYVEEPTVTTQAVELGAVKGDIHDVAFVEGPVSEAKHEVDFTLFLKPEAGQPKYDENWNKQLDENGDVILWTEDELNDPAAVCEAQPVGKTDRVKVDGEGEYTSPSVRAETEGTVYWVEELFVFDPETDEEISLHRGECGLPNETTFVERPTVTTKAVDEAHVGDKIFDTAIVDGPLSEREEISYEVTFEAYHRDTEKKGPVAGVDEAMCTVDTKVWETDEPTAITTAGEYKSEKWKVKEEHIGEILWVETLWEIEKTDEGENRSEIHRGECGVANEITKVSEKPELAFTGSAFGNTALLSGLVLLLAGGALAFAHRRKAEDLVRECEG